MSTPTRTIAAPGSGRGNRLSKLREFRAFREVLPNLVRKELKLRYKNSALGFVWSMVTPLMYLVVFYIVFRFFLTQLIPSFHVYFLSGLLAWTLFATSLTQATGSIVGNADLVKKVYFPRQLLPMSSIGAASVHFFLQFGVLVVFLVLSRFGFAGSASLLVPVALVVELLLLAGLSMLLSAVNVKARDVSHLLELGLLAWFWMTPIVYPSAPIAERLASYSLGGVSLLGVWLANPMARIVLGFQRGIYGPPTKVGAGETFPVMVDAPLSWYFEGLGYAAIVGVAVFVLGAWVFSRLDSSFAEEL